MTDKSHFYTYIGTKIVQASPMSEMEYYALRCWNIPDHVRKNKRQGYLVEYSLSDGEEPNHDNYKGYISWSPRATFETCYRVIGHHDNVYFHSLVNDGPRDSDVLAVIEKHINEVENFMCRIKEAIKEAKE
jgi:hypothetical protein